MPRRLLIIDDSRLIREAAKLGLAQAGWTVQACEDAASGVQEAAASRPDAILLDLVLPDADGIEVLETLRGDARTADVPVLLMTAASDRAAVARADGVIDKPFAPLELAGQVRALLGWEP